MPVSRNSSTQQSSASFSGRVGFVFAAVAVAGNCAQEGGGITKDRVSVKTKLPAFLAGFAVNLRRGIAGCEKRRKTVNPRRGTAGCEKRRKMKITIRKRSKSKGGIKRRKDPPLSMSYTYSCSFS